MSTHTMPSPSCRTGRNRRRVLFIAYTFPPIGGAGVQRTTKFVKFLGDHGWDASVLTVEGGSVPVWDDSLGQDIAQTSTIVRRARTFEPSYALKRSAESESPTEWRSPKQRMKRLAHGAARAALQPDAQVLWVPHAWQQALRLLKDVKHDAIIATGPPFSSLLLGAALAQKVRLPLILDYRDEWDLSNLYYENRRPGRFATYMQQQMQSWALRRAAVVLATTKASAVALAKRIRTAGADGHATWIYNGYDPDDFSRIAAPERQEGKFRIVYTGTLWNLMPIDPLVKALKRLSVEAPDIVRRIEIVVAGRRTPQQQGQLDLLRSLPCTVVEHSYLNHDEAIRLMCSADMLCLLLADLPGADRWVPAKTFEYIATGVPVLAVVPHGELQDLLKEHTTTIVGPDDVDALTRTLIERVSAPPASWEERRQFMCRSNHSRPNQAGQLASLLDSLCLTPPGQPAIDPERRLEWARLS